LRKESLPLKEDTSRKARDFGEGLILDKKGEEGAAGNEI